MTNDRHPNEDGRERAHDAPRTPANDPRLTAYALGELDAPEDAEARAQIESLLATDAAAREQVARVRELAGTLRAELAAEAQDGPVPTLGASQRAALDVALAERDAGDGGGAAGGSFRAGHVQRPGPALFEGATGPGSSRCVPGGDLRAATAVGGAGF
jgi:anti-sigma factor RsiW